MTRLKPILFLILMLLAVAALSAQYNEKDILTQQAYQMLAQRQFSEAEKLFSQVLEKYPDDANTVIQLLNIYFQTSQLDKAENLLNNYRRILPANQATEQEILLLVMQGKPGPAWDLGQTYLQRQSYSDNAYRVVASYFERRGFYDQVIQLYQDARFRRKNPELFRLEIANASLNYRLFDQALLEYLAFLDKNPANLFFVNNQCKTILKEDSTRIATLGDYAGKSGNPIIKELYANALLSQKKYRESLEVYKGLPQDRLLAFADQQYLAFNDEIALPSYQYLEQSSQDPLSANEYRLRQANIHFRNGRFQDSIPLLEKILADSLMREPRNYQRKGINLNARKLMAESVLALRKDTRAASGWYAEARKFCTNAYDQQDIDLSLVRLLLIDEDYQAARNKLAGVTDPKHEETRNYLRFEVELLSGGTDLADSLMNEYVIKFPSGIYVNDAIYQMMFTLSLGGSDRERFFQAGRLMMLQDPSAVDSLKSIFDSNQDEELLTLAVEWAILLAQRDKAAALLDRAWLDPVSAEYAALLKLSLSEDGEQEQRSAREFLKANPNSIFAPKFRQSLSRINASRPDF
jgi:thioredoxin-like negative regulator of GroEL